MKVALFVHSYFPESGYGTETFTRTIARHLRNLGHEPVVVTTGGGEEGRDSRYSLDGVQVIVLPRPPYYSMPYHSSVYSSEMAEFHDAVLRQVEPDVVHVCHLANHTTAILFAAGRLRIPSVASLTDYYSVCLNGIMTAVDGSLCGGPDPHRVNCMACHVSMGVERRNARLRRALRGGVPIVISRVLHLFGRLGVDVSIGRLKGSDATLRARVFDEAFGTCQLAISPTRALMKTVKACGFGPPIEHCAFGIDLPPSSCNQRPSVGLCFGYLGQIAPHKGVHTLIEAFSMLESQTATLRIWGDLRDRPEYVAQLETLIDCRDVILEGPFESGQIANVLCGIDVLVVPSTWSENSPFTALYALAAHVPVICSGVPGLAEIIQHGVNGLHFTVGSPKDLSDRLRECLARPDLVSRLRRGAHYTRTGKQMVLELLSFYDIAIQRAQTASLP